MFSDINCVSVEASALLRFCSSSLICFIFFWSNILFWLFFFDIARSSQINAYKGVDLKTAHHNIHCTSQSDCITEPNWKSRFCYHLYYQRIIHTYRTYTVRHSYMTMGLVAEVVVHLTCKQHWTRQRCLINRTPLRQSKLRADRTFASLQLKASHQTMG